MKEITFSRPRMEVFVLPLFLMILQNASSCGHEQWAETALLVSLPLLSFWATHYAMLTEKEEKHWWLFPGFLFYDFLCMILAYIPFGIFMPITDCYTDRIKVAAVLSYAYELRHDIDTQLQHHAAVTALEKAPSDAPGKFLHFSVSSDGKMIFVTRAPLAVIRLVPVKKGSAIAWDCHGYPPKVLPATCR